MDRTKFKMTVIEDPGETYESYDILDSLFCMALSSLFSLPEEEEHGLTEDAIAMINRQGGLNSFQKIVSANSTVFDNHGDRELVDKLKNPLSYGLKLNEHGLLVKASAYDTIVGNFPHAGFYEKSMSRYQLLKKRWQPYLGTGHEPCHVCFIGGGGSGKTVMMKKLMAMFSHTSCIDSNERFADGMPKATTIEGPIPIKVVSLDVLSEDEVGMNGGDVFHRRLFQVVNSNITKLNFSKPEDKGTILDTNFYFTTTNGITWSEEQQAGGMAAINRRFHIIVRCERGIFTTLEKIEDFPGKQGSCISAHDLIGQIIQKGTDLLAQAVTFRESLEHGASQSGPANRAGGLKERNTIVDGSQGKSNVLVIDRPFNTSPRTPALTPKNEWI